jgi:hypothetical protein
VAQASDFTPEEWKAIRAAPVAAGLLVTLADASGPAGIAKEAIAVSKAITHAGGGAASELIRSIADSFQQSGGRPDMPEIPRDREQATGALIGMCQDAVTAVGRKSTADADEFKRWLVQVARQTAEASKEGGFLGFGGTQVSQAEHSVVERLGRTLGLGAGT